MKAASSCTSEPIELAGVEYMPIVYGTESEGFWAGVVPPDRCHDCFVALGGYHHPGCDMEQCPRCLGQLLGCDCESSDEESRGL